MDYNVYNYYLGNYAPKPMTKYDTHKSSELRSVMKNITKITQSSPVYLVDLSKAKQEYALNIKDAAISLNNTLMMLSDDSSENVFSQKKAHSSDEEQASARIVTEDYDSLPEAPMIRVNSLASSQVNLGNEYYNTGKGLSAGTYRFRISVNEDNYDFQYNIRKDATHREVIDGLSSFINKAKIGLTATPVSRSADKIMMRVESNMTGSSMGEDIFSFEDRTGENGDGRGIVSYYNLNNVVSHPTSASFELNGETKSALSNTFTLGRALEVSLYRPGEEGVQISYIPDSDKIIDSVQSIMDSYNKLVDSTEEYGKTSEQRPRLVQEYRRIMAPFQSDLESCGISFDESGRMQMDQSLTQQAALEGDVERLFGKDSSLSRRISQKNEEIKLNPMEYIDKTLVSYPDFGKPPRGFSYITSLYSGMLFNYYC
jgi:flagellar hook-associated protein 2